jgi:hypothetical protein
VSVNEDCTKYCPADTAARAVQLLEKRFERHVEKFPNIGKIWVMKVFRKELGSKRVETF